LGSSAPEHREARADVVLLAALTATWFAANAGGYMMPILIGSIAAQYQVAVTAAAGIFSAQIGAIALPSLLAAPRIDRWDRRRFALLSAGLVVVGYVLSAVAPNVQVFAVSRVLAGLGEGGLMAAATAIAAGLPNPQRVFAMLTFATVAMTIGVYVGVPEIVSAHGVRASFVVIAALGIGALLCTGLLPAHRAPSAPGKAEPPAKLWSAVTLGICAAQVLFVVGSNLVFYFTEQSGTRETGMDLREIGRTLAIASVASTVGPPLAAALVARLGHRMPSIAALAISAAGSYLMTHTNSRAVFVGVVVVTSIMTFFLFTSIMSWAAAASPDGRIATAAQGVSVLGNSATPIAAGLALSQFGAGGVGWFSVFLLLSAAALVFLTPLAVVETIRGTRP
jgi:predicted MFS family arabinose efflux permease